MRASRGGRLRSNAGAPGEHGQDAAPAEEAARDLHVGENVPFLGQLERPHHDCTTAGKGAVALVRASGGVG